MIFLGQQAQKAVTAPEAEKYQIQAQRSAAVITAKSAQEQIESINEQIEEMKVRSPRDGIITSWEVRKNLLGRPVEIGQELIAVASTEGEWVLEVEVPDDDMGPVLDAQSKLEEEIKQGKKPVGTRLKPTSSRPPTPSIAIPATSSGSGRKPSWSRPSTWSR